MQAQSFVLDGKRQVVEAPKGIEVRNGKFRCLACKQEYIPTSASRLGCPHNCNAPGLVAWSKS